MSCPAVIPQSLTVEELFHNSYVPLAPLLLREVVIKIRLRLRGLLPLILSALRSHESLLPHLSLEERLLDFRL